MRHEKVQIICDICVAGNLDESLADRLNLVLDDGRVHRLDICGIHLVQAGAQGLSSLARRYGVQLRARVDQYSRIQFHPAGRYRSRWREPAGEYEQLNGSSRVRCLVPHTYGPCGDEFNNDVGLKRHQYSAHGLRIGR